MYDTKVADFQPNGHVCKVFHETAYWLCPAGLLTSRDRGATWQKTGDACPGSIGPMFDAADERHLATAGAEGIFESADGGKSWSKITTLPPKFDVPKPGGWFTNVAWDPKRNLFYISRMGQPTLKLEASPKNP